MKTGKTIKTLRKSCNMSQSDLAKRAKTSQDYISQLENEDRDLSPNMAKKISKVLDVPVPLIYALSMDNSDTSSLVAIRNECEVFKIAIARFFEAYEKAVNNKSVNRFR